MTYFLQINSRQIGYDLSGEGPLVVCAPSLGDIRSEYRYLVPQLITHGFSVATMDVRGHGESSPNWPDYSVAAVGSDILALIDHLNCGPAILVGTSMAGGAAVYAAAEQKEKVRALVLIDPFVDGNSNPFLVFILSILFARPWGVNNWIKYYTSLYPTRKSVDFQNHLYKLKENLTQSGRLEAVIAMLKASKKASGERLNQVTQPSLIIMGSKDPDFPHPVEEAERVAALLNSRKVIIPNAGHYPHAEMPEVTGQAILKFLESLYGEK